MYLVDSNIIVYSYLNEYEYLKGMLRDQRVYVSEISRIEVLGYHNLSVNDENYFRDIFRVIPIIYPDRKIFDTTIKIRRQYNLKLGDSIIAATALLKDLTLYTRNLKDFNKVENLRVIDPMR